MSNKKTNWGKKLNTVTTFSKVLAAVLFVSLPFIGFYLGTVYSNYTKNIFSNGNKVNFPQNSLKQDKNTVSITTENDNQIVNLTLYGVVKPLSNPPEGIDYYYTIELFYPIIQGEAVHDASGIDKPKYSYILYFPNQNDLEFVKKNENKAVKVIGTLEYGFAETRHVKVNTISLY